jgi:hypothetical protein
MLATIKPVNSSGEDVVEMRLYLSNTQRQMQPNIAPAVPGPTGKYPDPSADAYNLYIIFMEKNIIRLKRSELTPVNMRRV